MLKEGGTSVAVAGAMHDVQVPTGVLRYRRAGSGPPLLLLHGWAASSRYWLDTLAALDDRACYAFDMPGFGESPALAQPSTPAALAAVVLEAADALGLEQFDLGGHSFGASVAVMLAARHPQRVRRLVLTSFGLPPTAALEGLYSLVQPTLRLGLVGWQPLLNLFDPWVRLWHPWQRALLHLPSLPGLIGSWYAQQPPTAAQLAAGLDDLVAMDLRAHTGSLFSVGAPDIAAAFATVSAPTLLLSGCNDRVLPPDTVAAAHAYRPSSEVVLFADCGHLPMLEQPQAYYAALRRFLA